MSTPNDRLLEILENGVDALDERGDLTESEVDETKDFIEYLVANIEDMRPEDEELDELEEDDEEEDEH